MSPLLCRARSEAGLKVIYAPQPVNNDERWAHQYCPTFHLLVLHRLDSSICFTLRRTQAISSFLLPSGGGGWVAVGIGRIGMCPQEVFAASIRIDSNITLGWQPLPGSWSWDGRLWGVKVQLPHCHSCLNPQPRACSGPSHLHGRTHLGSRPQPQEQMGLLVFSCLLFNM